MILGLSSARIAEIAHRTAWASFDKMKAGPVACSHPMDDDPDGANSHLSIPPFIARAFGGAALLVALLFAFGANFDLPSPLCSIESRLEAKAAAHSLSDGYHAVRVLNPSLYKRQDGIRPFDAALSDVAALVYRVERWRSALAEYRRSITTHPPRYIRHRVLLI